MPEVLMLKISCFVIPTVLFFSFLFNGKNPFYGLLAGIGLSIVLVLGCVLGWYLEDTKEDRRWRSKRKYPKRSN